MRNEIVPLHYPCGNSWSGMFLVLRESGNILIDTAFAPSIENLLLPALARRGMAPDDIDFVINTHMHADHFSGNAPFKKISKATLAAFELSAPKLRDPYPSMNAIRSKFAPELPFVPIAPGIASMEPDLILKDGDHLGDLMIVHTPGHDNDSICLFDERTGILFSGDSLQGVGTPSSGVAFYQSRAEYLYTLDTVEKLDVKKILAGHPFHPTDGTIDDVSGFMKLCRETVWKYDEVLKDAGKTCTTMPEFVKYLLKEAGIEQNPSVPVLTWHTVATHLEFLNSNE